MTEALALGIDPGTARLGYGLVAARGDSLRYLTCGVIQTPAGQPLPERLRTIYDRLQDIIREHQPTLAAVELLFFTKNAQSAFAVGQARGVALLACVNAGLPVGEYTPLQVKQAVVGYGKASKEQVGDMIRVLLSLDAVPSPDDAADALAIAICHLNASRFHAILNQSAAVSNA